MSGLCEHDENSNQLDEVPCQLQALKSAGWSYIKFVDSVQHNTNFVTIFMRNKQQMFLVYSDIKSFELGIYANNI